MIDQTFLSLLNEAAGAMGAMKNKEFQKMLAANGAGENSKHTTKTITVHDAAELSKVMNLSALARQTRDNVAGVVCYWNGTECLIRTQDTKSKYTTLGDIQFPGFLTTMVFYKDETRQEIGSFRDFAATAPVRKIIVNAIRTLRSNADQLENNINQGAMQDLQVLVGALRQSVATIEANAKALA